eukprot:8940968-Lingulodinium_polyedra.AAC.1
MPRGSRATWNSRACAPRAHARRLRQAVQGCAQTGPQRGARRSALVGACPVDVCSRMVSIIVERWLY